MRAASRLALLRSPSTSGALAPMRPAAVALFVALFVAVALASCRGGCHQAPRAARPLDGRLALFPIEARTVAALDLDKVRAAPMAARLASLALASPGDQARLDQFRQRTGLDPGRQIESVIVAFPEEARVHGELGIVLRASRFDEARLIGYVRDTLQKDGDDLVPTQRGRRTLWSARKDPSLAGFFLDGRTLVVGGGGWAAKMADLSNDGAAASGSAETNLELVQLCERAAAGHAIWAAAIVPADLRRQLEGDPRFASAASVNRMALGIDLGAGLDAAFSADLSDAPQAQALVSKVNETLQAAKRDPRALMLGLGPDVDGVTTRADGATFSLKLSLSELQVGDLLDRAAAFLTLARQGRAPGFGR